MKPRKGLDGKFECYKNFSKNGEATPTRSIKMSLAYSMLLLFPTSRLFSHWSLSRPWESIGECAPRRRRRPSLHYSAFLSSIPLSPQSEMPILDKVFSITAAVSSHCSSSKQLRRLISNFHPLLHHISAFAFTMSDIVWPSLPSNLLLCWTKTFFNQDYVHIMNKNLLLKTRKQIMSMVPSLPHIPAMWKPRLCERLRGMLIDCMGPTDGERSGLNRRNLTPQQILN